MSPIGTSGVRRVQLIQVNVVGPQPVQAILYRLPHVVWCGTFPAVAEVHPELRRDHHVLALPPERLPKEPLAVRLSVHVRGIEEGDPRLKGGRYNC